MKSPLAALFVREFAIARRIDGVVDVGVVFLLLLVAILPFSIRPGPHPLPLLKNRFPPPRPPWRAHAKQEFRQFRRQEAEDGALIPSLRREIGERRRQEWHRADDVAAARFLSIEVRDIGSTGFLRRHRCGGRGCPRIREQRRQCRIGITRRFPRGRRRSHLLGRRNPLGDGCSFRRQRRQRDCAGELPAQRLAEMPTTDMPQPGHVKARKPLPCRGFVNKFGSEG